MSAAIATPAPTPMAVAPKKAKSPKKTGAKKPAAASTHPAWADMITAAVKALGEKGGSSVSAIKKYMIANYKIDAEKAGPFMKRGIKAAIAGGSLVQAKGKGLTGSFKLGAGKPVKKAKTASKKSKLATKKPAGE